MAIWQRPICFFMLAYPPVQGFVLISNLFQFGLGGAAPQTPWFLAEGGKAPPDLPRGWVSPGAAARWTPPCFFFPSTAVFAVQSSTESETKRKKLGEFFYPYISSCMF